MKYLTLLAGVVAPVVALSGQATTTVRLVHMFLQRHQLTYALSATMMEPKVPAAAARAPPPHSPGNSALTASTLLLVHKLSSAMIPGAVLAAVHATSSHQLALHLPVRAPVALPASLSLS